MGELGGLGTRILCPIYFYLNAMEAPNPGAAIRKYFGLSEKKLLAAWAGWID